jgi:trk system potassium uptake protein TrkA
VYVIIVGAGDIGSQLIELATRESHDVVVIEKDEATASDVAQNYDCLVLNTDATTMDALEEAGGNQADAIISTTESDATNIMVMLLAQELDIPSQVSIVHSPEHMDLLRQLGVNVLENPEHLIAEYLYRAVQWPSVKDFIHLSGNAEIFEITVVETAPIANVTLREADENGLLDDGVRVVAIERDGTTQLPTGDTVVESGDRLSVLSLAGAMPEVARTFTGNNRASHV